MTDTRPAPLQADADRPRSAGALLKAAREREGLHLAVLAATIKVSPAKLEALEQDRYAELPNATFARALAQSVCRSLKIDPRPVLALLPQTDAPPLEGAMGSLNTPFQERSSRGDGLAGLTWATKPLFWAGGVLLVAAVAVALIPGDVIDRWKAGVSGLPADDGMARAPGPGASAGMSSAALPSASSMAAAVAPSVAGSAAGLAAGDGQGSGPGVGAGGTLPGASPANQNLAAAVPTQAQVPASAAPARPASAALPSPAALPLPTQPVAATAAPAGLLRLTASAATWVEVTDSRGQVVFSRTLQAGEVAGVDGVPPLRARIGNVAGTALTFRGQAVDLAPYTRDNVARLDLR